MIPLRSCSVTPSLECLSGCDGKNLYCKRYPWRSGNFDKDVLKRLAKTTQDVQFYEYRVYRKDGEIICRLVDTREENDET